MSHLKTIRGGKKWRIGQKAKFNIEGKQIELTCYAWFVDYDGVTTWCFNLF